MKTKKLLFFIFGTLLSLVLLEAGISLSFHFFESQLEASNTATFAENELRIMTVGESTTAVAADDGNHFLFSHTSYPAALQKELKKKWPQRKIKVINKGVMSGNSSVIIDNLEENLIKYKPHILIAMMGMKDEKENFHKRVTIHSFAAKINELIKGTNVYRFFELLQNYLQLDQDLKNDHTVLSFSDINPHFNKRLKEKLADFLDDPKIIEFQPKTRSLVSKKLKLAIYFGLTQQFEKMEAALKTTIEEHDIGHNLLAHYLKRQKKYKQAIALLQKKIESSAEPFYFQFNLGKLLIDSGQYEQGRSLLLNISSQKPDFIPLHYEVARSLKFQRKHQMAIKHLLDHTPAESYTFGQDFELFPRGYFNHSYHTYNAMVAVLAEIGENHLLLKNHRAAISFLDRSVKLDSRRHYNLMILSQAYKESGQIEKSIQLHEYYTYKTNRLAEFYELSKVYIDDGSPEKAENLYRYARNQVPITAKNYNRLYELAKNHSAIVAFMQYPSFPISMTRSMAPGKSDIVFIDNESLFENSAPKKYFFEPRFPYRFNHYTKAGAELIAKNIIKHLEGLIEKNQLWTKTSSPSQ